MAQTYLFDWQETAHGEKPKSAEVEAWLTANGIALEGHVAVYANGMVQFLADVPEGINIYQLWSEFEPIPLTLDDQLGAHIKALLDARQDVLAIPENRRSALERLTLANTALLLYGYGITPDA